MENKSSFLKENSANLITVARIVLISYVYYLNLFYRNKLLIFCLLVIAAVSDALDGWVARKYKAETVLGKIIDPVADKYLIGSVMVIFWLWMYEAINFKEVWISLFYLATAFFSAVAGIQLFLIVAAVYFYFKLGIISPSNKWGKRKMWAECLALASWFILGELLKLWNLAFLITSGMLAFAIIFAIQSARGHYYDYQRQKQPRWWAPVEYSR